MNWFRMYIEARNDAKLRTLTDAEHRVWFNLLCYSSEREPRGSVTGVTSVTDVTDDLLLAIEVANGDLSLLSATVEKLMKLRILAIDENGLTFINFGARQYDKPSDMPEETRRRKAAQRERERAALTTTTPDESVTGVTPRDVTTRTDTEQSRTEQRESTSPDGDAPPSEKPKRETKRATAIPDDFPVTVDLRSWAAEKVPGVNLDRETEKFLNHFRSNGKTMKDWTAAWRNWMLRSAEYNPQPVIDAPSKPDRKANPVAWAIAEKARLEAGEWANHYERTLYTVPPTGEVNLARELARLTGIITASEVAA